MEILKNKKEPAYTPVAYEYKEVIQEQIEKQTVGKIFYFCTAEGICEAYGSVDELVEDQKDGLFVILDLGQKIRADRIITLFGKPGAAFDEYDQYSNSCMSCLGGYEPDELTGN